MKYRITPSEVLKSYVIMNVHFINTFKHYISFHKNIKYKKYTFAQVPTIQLKEIKYCKYN